MNRNGPITAIVAALVVAGCTTPSSPEAIQLMQAMQPYRAVAYGPTPATTGRSIVQLEGMNLARTRDGGWLKWRLVASPGGVGLQELAFQPNDANARASGWTLPLTPGRPAPPHPDTEAGCAFSSIERGGKLAVYVCDHDETLLLAFPDSGPPRQLARLKGRFQAAFLTPIPHVGAWSVTLAGIDERSVFHFAEMQWEYGGAIH